MTAYIFVLAICEAKTKEIRFHHKVVMADTPEDAYDEGARLARIGGIIPVAKGEFANDYVVKLVEE